jgi:two-component sensor histidine kinase
LGGLERNRRTTRIAHKKRIRNLVDFILPMFMGLHLVKGLVEEQLEGTLELQNTQGTTGASDFGKETP